MGKNIKYSLRFNNSYPKSMFSLPLHLHFNSILLYLHRLFSLPIPHSFLQVCLFISMSRSNNIKEKIESSGQALGLSQLPTHSLCRERYLAVYSTFINIVKMIFWYSNVEPLRFSLVMIHNQ
jgi:hypothetical protein